jgi:mRNA interferase RelE/StbE
MKIIQSGAFEWKVKKLSKKQKQQLDAAIREILKNPVIGEQKNGELKMVFIYKFHIDSTLFLIAYAFTPEILELIMLGPHENYYKDLKNYLRK